MKSFLRDGWKLWHSGKTGCGRVTAVYPSQRSPQSVSWRRQAYARRLEYFIFGKDAEFKTNILTSREASLNLDETCSGRERAVANSTSPTSQSLQSFRLQRSSPSESQRYKIKIPTVQLVNVPIGHQTSGTFVNGCNLATVPAVTFLFCLSKSSNSPVNEWDAVAPCFFRQHGELTWQILNTCFTSWERHRESASGTFSPINHWWPYTTVILPVTLGRFNPAHNPPVGDC